MIELTLFNDLLAAFVLRQNAMIALLLVAAGLSALSFILSAWVLYRTATSD